MITVSPAHAGIDPARPATSRRLPGLPRARGDRPSTKDANRARAASPPRTRGSTRGSAGLGDRCSVSPAHAGIDPALTAGKACGTCLPRARGDRPMGDTVIFRQVVSPPRTRGSTSRPPFDDRTPGVSPAHAGIDPGSTGRASLLLGLPRARGDRPLSPAIRSWRRESPPRTRGSTLSACSTPFLPAVSPAHAGIDLSFKSGKTLQIGLPRARGDRPHKRFCSSLNARSPPRTRGSTPFLTLLPANKPVSPAHAGIDLRHGSMGSAPWRLPRARGDRPGCGR